MDGLVRRRGGRAVVDGVSFRVAAGAIVGLIGLNGAGKTSLIECLAGLAAADAGTVTLAGHAPGTPAARAACGVLLQAPGLPPRLRVGEVLALFAGLAGVAPDALVDAGVSGLLGLDALARVRVDRLSGGQRQRLALAVALLGAPPVLLLDEPGSALDPAMRGALAGLLAARRAAGAAILLATHDLAEAARLCDHVVLLHHGRLLAAGRPADLIAAAGAPSRIRLETAQPLAGEAGALIELTSHQVAADLAALLARVGDVPVLDLAVTGPTLADVLPTGETP